MLQFKKGSGDVDSHSDCIGFSSVCSVKGVALRGRSRAGQSSGVEIERSVITVEVEMLGVSDVTAYVLFSCLKMEAKKECLQEWELRDLETGGPFVQPRGA